MRRLPVVGALVVLLVVAPLAGQLLTLYTDWLWFEEVGFRGVFTTILATKAWLGLGAGALMFVLLFPNLRLTGRARDGDVPDLEGGDELPQLPPWALIAPLYRRLVLPACLLASLLVGGRVTGQWLEAIRFLHAGSFGVTEPLYGRDVGFYVFRYPFLTALADLLQLPS